MNSHPFYVNSVRCDAIPSTASHAQPSQSPIAAPTTTDTASVTDAFLISTIAATVVTDAPLPTRTLPPRHLTWPKQRLLIRKPNCLAGGDKGASRWAAERTCGRGRARPQQPGGQRDQRAGEGVERARGSSPLSSKEEPMGIGCAGAAGGNVEDDEQEGGEEIERD